MNNTLSYAINGAIRSTMGVGFGVIGLAAIKAAFELNSRQSFTDFNPEASQAEIYQHSGLLTKHITGWMCNIEDEGTSTMQLSKPQEECLQDVHKLDEDVSPFVMILPAVLLISTGKKFLPKGLSYLQLAFNQVMNKDERALTPADFKRDKSFPTPKH